MAGSFSHVGGKDGSWSLVKNMGDAYETVEQLLWLVYRTIGQSEAESLIDGEFYPMKRGERPKDQAMYETESRMTGQRRFTWQS